MSDGKEKKEKLVVRSPSMVEKAVRRKWLLYGGIAVGVIWFLAMTALDDKQRTPRERPPEFVDTTPDIRQSDERAFAKMQRELRLAAERMEMRDKAYQRQLEEMRKAMDAEREEREKRLAELKAQHAEELAAIKAEQEKAQKEQQKREESAEKPSFADYIRPPRVGADNEIVPPPPLARPDRDSEVASRPNLPPRQSDGPQIGSPRPSSQRTDPIVLDSGSSVSDARILRGPEKAEEDAPEQAKMAGFVPAGSFAEVALITGADFGASDRTQSNPQPVLMRVQADAILPGRAKYELRDCFSLGSGYGELSSERAYVQTARLSCVDASTGQILETEFQGYLVDSDGKLGLRGTVARRSGVLLGKAMLAGFAEGAAELLSTASGDSEQFITGSGLVTSLSPDDVGKVGLYGGAGRAAEILAEQYIKEAESMFPVIEIDAGRKGTVVIQIGQKLEWTPYVPEQKG